MREKLPGNAQSVQYMSVTIQWLFQLAAYLSIVTLFYPTIFPLPRRVKSTNM